MRWEIYGGTNLFSLKEKKENNLSDQKDKTREEQKPLVCALLLPVLHIFSLPLKKRAQILLSGFLATELSTNGQKSFSATVVISEFNLVSF